MRQILKRLEILQKVETCHRDISIEDIMTVMMWCCLLILEWQGGFHMRGIVLGGDNDVLLIHVGARLARSDHHLLATFVCSSCFNHANSSDDCVRLSYYRKNTLHLNMICWLLE